MTTTAQEIFSARVSDRGLLGDLLTPGREYQSLYGYTFVVDSPRWELSKGVAVNVGFVAEKLQPHVAQGFVATLVHMARTHSAHHTSNCLDRFRHFIEKCGCDEVTTAALINYRSTLDKSTEWYMGVVRVLMYKWFELGYPGMDESIVNLLRGWNLKGNIKGDAIKRRDPASGDFTENELSAFNEGAARAFENGSVNITELAMAILMSCTGRRAKQISHMKIQDLEISAYKNNEELQRLIQIPRAKQRGSIFRDSFNTFLASNDLWLILQAQRKKCIRDAEIALGHALKMHEQQLLPLFPDVDALRACKSSAEFQSLLLTDRLHCSPQSVNDVLKKIVETSGCYSERTGELLCVTSRRFRYTTGTRAARQGIGVAGIAELLDHTDTQSAHVYVKNIPEHVAAIDEAVGHQLAPYAQAFQGVVVDSERDAKRGDDSTSRIRFRGRAAATCGKFGDCGANVPIPCYTCMFFQPWLDGPHEAVYAQLVADRARILEETRDETIAAINDRTIFAVAEVIRRCEERREELVTTEGA
jgi:integrase